MARRESTITGNAEEVSRGREERPRIVFLHFSAPPVVGGVEAVIAEQIRLFRGARYPTLVIAGREAEAQDEEVGKVKLIPEMDSENPQYMNVQPALEKGEVPDEFAELQHKIEAGLRETLKPSDVVIAHNIMTTHFNLALTAAVHKLVHEGVVRHLIIWCHDLSRHVNPERDEEQYHGMPWDLLRTRIQEARYVAVSSSRKNSLAKILNCPPDAIQVIPNGVDATQLLGLTEMGKELVGEFDLFSADLILLMPVRITKVKNIEFALEVAKALKDAEREVRLIITGPPDPHVLDIPEYYEKLLQRRNQLGLEHEAVFIHEGTRKHPWPLVIEADVVGELYRIADIILMPSIREGFGMPVLEAGMADRPVFATRIPVVEDLPDFRYVIEADETAESVAKRMLAWAEADAAHTLRRYVRTNLTWAKIFARRILPLVESLVGAENGPAK